MIDAAALQRIRAGTLAAALSERGFVVGTSSRASTRLDLERRDLPTLIRIAPHYYNTEEEIAACVGALGELVRPS